MGTYRIVSIEKGRPRGTHHDVVVAVHTQDAFSADERWPVKTVLEAMNRAERFYTEASNGRRARVQRYQCAPCRTEHIRTHVSDRAIHELRNLPVA